MTFVRIRDLFASLIRQRQKEDDQEEKQREQI